MVRGVRFTVLAADGSVFEVYEMGYRLGVDGRYRRALLWAWALQSALRVRGACRVGRASEVV